MEKVQETTGTKPSVWPGAGGCRVLVRAAAETEAGQSWAACPLSCPPFSVAVTPGVGAACAGGAVGLHHVCVSLVGTM